MSSINGGYSRTGACPYPKMSRIRSQINQKDGFLSYSPPLASPYGSNFQKSSAPPFSSSGNKISPAVLFIIIILAIIFFISGLLHLLVRFLIKQRFSSSISRSNRYPEMSGSSEAFQRQLQQLFQLHDSGLDQAFIDALPVFLYKEIRGPKEPFDCAVCLCEFSEHDKLRLLPLCTHAFHIDCIDTWLLSNSTCPLCRGTLFTPGFAIENPVFDIEDSREEDVILGNGGDVVSFGPKAAANEIVAEKRVFSVRLGKYRSLINAEGRGGEARERGEGETSSSNLDARRCYSMGSFQYVVANSDLQVALCQNVKVVKERGGQNGNSSIDGDTEGKKINIGSKGESFSVSKIWLWSKKGKFLSSSDAHTSTSVNVGLPWTDRTQGT